MHLTLASEMLSQCQMVWMLLSLSVGWTMGSGATNPLRDTRQLSSITIITLTHVLLVLWEQTYDESHYTYHIHESFPGFLLVMLRFGLVGLLTYNLKRTLANERSELRRQFYNSFAIVSSLLYVVSYSLFSTHTGLLLVVFGIPNAHVIGCSLCSIPQTQGTIAVCVPLLFTDSL